MKFKLQLCNGGCINDELQGARRSHVTKPESLITEDDQRRTEAAHGAYMWFPFGKTGNWKV
jgi:hypothetical protein